MLPRLRNSQANTCSFPTVLVTATIQLLLWRDRKIAAKLALLESLSTSRDSDPDSPALGGSEFDEKKVVRDEISAVV